MQRHYCHPWLALLLAIGIAFAPIRDARAHSVGQTQTTKFLAPESVQLLKDRISSGGTPGFTSGDVVSYIIQFTPVSNGATVGVAGYVTDYISPGTRVVGASMVQPSGASYIDVAPSLPGSIDNGWGRGQNTFSGVFANTGIGGYDTTGLCAANGKGANCNGSLAQLHADTGIFFSTDSRTSVFPAYPTRILQGTNGYFVNPTAVGQLDTIVGNPANIATTHNLWDASMTNAFGSGALPGGTPQSPQVILSNNGSGGTPFGAGSPVAGPDTGFPLDYTGTTGPWQRISYSGSRIGTRATGPALTTSSTSLETTADPFAIRGSYTLAGHSLSLSNPLPSSTNALRFAIGELVVGQIKYAKISLQLTAPPAATGLQNFSEVFGGDAGGADDGKDNPWRYHVPSVADTNSNLFLIKEVVCVYTALVCNPSNGATIPVNAKLRYRITYFNSGAGSQSNVVLSDTLPTQTGAGSVSNVVVVTGPNILPISPAAPVAGGTFSFQTIATLVAGAGGSVEFDVQTNAAAGTTVTNTSKLVSTALPAGLTSKAVSAVVNTAFLAMTKSSSPARVAPGQEATYTLTITNTGSAAASTIVLRDYLPSAGGTLANQRFNFVTGSSLFTGLTTVTPTVNAPTTTSPYNGLNREEVIWNFGAQTLAVGATATVTFRAVVGAAVPPNPTTLYVNQASVTYTPGTNNASAGTLVQFIIDLKITKTDNTAFVTAGGTTTYDLLITNTGPSAADGATVRDPVVPGLTATSVTCVSPLLGAVCPAAGLLTIPTLTGGGIVIPTLPAGGSLILRVVANVTATGS